MKQCSGSMQLQSVGVPLIYAVRAWCSISYSTSCSSSSQACPTCASLVVLTAGYSFLAKSLSAPPYLPTYYLPAGRRYRCRHFLRSVRVSEERGSRLELGCMHEWVVNNRFPLALALFYRYLIAHIWLQEIRRRQGSFSYPRFILRRFLRIWPALAASLGVTMAFYALSGDTESLGLCTCDWWAILLFINNWIPIQAGVLHAPNVSIDRTGWSKRGVRATQ